ncbi:mannose-6-phosphate isomerase, class I [Oerskovia sp. NPDC060287]|uniref:mannose-6-phosphate isomerase, class I n=1 Tax=Oerskovia sp. NPDC060287 TaxID=3347095 RepID=UPI00366763E8
MIDRPRHLENTVQHYDWGSPTAIPGLLGVEPDGRPAAELWLGAHGSAPSTVSTADGTVPLDTLIHQYPDVLLGRRTVEAFGPRLPFLLKALAAQRALSLQVHPKPHVARAGFNRENVAGLPRSSPERTFHDDQHKPEMVVALTQFDGLAGFRQPRVILDLLDGLNGDLVTSIRSSLRSDPSPLGLRTAFEHSLSARHDPGLSADLERTTADIRERVENGSSWSRADSTALALSEQHPGDPGAISSLMLNRVTLDPGESIFVPAGEIHAYLSGFCIEVMASSDNVVRAGLTSKRMDLDALMQCTSFEARPPAAPQITVSGAQGEIRTYRAPVPEFALVMAEPTVLRPVELPTEGPRIVLCLDGDLQVTCDTGEERIIRGQSIFVPHASGALTVSGTGQIVCAYVP